MEHAQKNTMELCVLLFFIEDMQLSLTLISITKGVSG